MFCIKFNNINRSGSYFSLLNIVGEHMGNKAVARIFFRGGGRVFGVKDNLSNGGLGVSPPEGTGAEPGKLSQFQSFKTNS